MLRRLLASASVIVLASAQAHAGALTQLPFGVDRTASPAQVCIVGVGATCLAPIGTFAGGMFSFVGDGSALTYANPAAARSSLGLGAAATAGIGPGAGQVAAGNDTRFSSPSITGGTVDGAALGLASPIGSLIGQVSMTYGIKKTAVGCSHVVNSTHDPQVLGFVSPASVGNYADRDSVGCYFDNTAPPLIANVPGTFTSTTFIPSSPLSAAVVSQLRVGMLVDTSDITKFTGTITGWAADGSSITVSNWYQQGSGGVAGLPSGSSAYINPTTKIWALNANIYFNPSSWATAGTGFELGIINNQGYNSATDTPYTWGFDAVNLGTYTASKAHIARGDWNYGFQSQNGAGRLASFHADASANPAGVGFLSDIANGTGFQSNQVGGQSFVANGNTGGQAFAAKNSNGTVWQINGGDGSMDFGSQTTVTTPSLKFHAGGTTQTDAAFNGVAGPAGSPYSGYVAFLAKGIYVNSNSGVAGQGDNAILYGGSVGANQVGLRVSGSDTNIDWSIAGQGTGRVLLNTHLADYWALSGAATGASVKQFPLGSDTNINVAMGAKGTGLMCLGALTDCGNDAFRIAQVASQVNGLQIKGAIAGGSALLSAIGSDTNINLAMGAKGTGLICLGALTDCGNDAFRVAQVASQVNGLQVKGAIAGGGVTLAAIGSDTNISANISGKGTGAITLGSATSPAKLTSLTVAALPACNSTYQDAMYVVTDATSPTYRGALTGGGSVRTPVYCDGSSWTAH